MCTLLCFFDLKTLPSKNYKFNFNNIPLDYTFFDNSKYLGYNGSYVNLFLNNHQMPVKDGNSSPRFDLINKEKKDINSFVSNSFVGYNTFQSNFLNPNLANSQSSTLGKKKFLSITIDRPLFSILFTKEFLSQNIYREDIYNSENSLWSLLLNSDYLLSSRIPILLYDRSSSKSSTKYILKYLNIRDLLLNYLPDVYNKLDLNLFKGKRQFYGLFGWGIYSNTYLHEYKASQKIGKW